jgi:MFS family permease
MDKALKKGWFISLVGGLFFFYGIMLTNMMTSFNSTFVEVFQIGPKEIGLLSAVAFYSQLLFLIPAGLFIDRFSVRKLMIINLGIGVVGTLIVAFAPNFSFLIGGRFLSGVMLSFAFVSCMKLASSLLPPASMALASALIVTLGMIGGFVAQSPLSFLINKFGWSEAAVIIALIGAIIAVVIRIFVIESKKEEVALSKKVGVFKELKKVICFSQNWYAGWFISLTNLPLAILGAAFGTPYLMRVYDFHLLTAASVTSMLFVGMIFGSPFFGWLANVLKNRRLAMLVGSVGCLVFSLLFIYISSWSVFSLHFLCFLIGFTSAAQVLGYPVVTDNNPIELTGTALSLAVIIIMGGGYGLGIPFVGWALAAGRDYMSAMENYRLAFSIIPVGLLIGTGLTFLMKCEVKK